MKNIIRTGLAMLLLALILTAASVVFMRAHAADSNQADSVSEIRPVSAAVVNIVMTGPIDLALRQAATPDLQVRGAAKMRGRVTTRIEGNTLYIGTRGIFMSFGSPQSPRVELSLPTLEKLHIQGSGDARVQGFKGAHLDLSLRGSGDLHFDGEYQQIQADLTGSGDLSMSMQGSDLVELSLLGSGDAVLKGQAKTLHAKISGSGDLDGAALKAASVSLNSMGSADAVIYATQEVSLRLMGSGDVRVYGKPAKRTVERIGSGEISWE